MFKNNHAASLLMLSELVKCFLVECLQCTATSENRKKWKKKIIIKINNRQNRWMKRNFLLPSFDSATVASFMGVQVWVKRKLFHFRSMWRSLLCTYYNTRNVWSKTNIKELRKMPKWRKNCDPVSSSLISTRQKEKQRKKEENPFRFFSLSQRCRVERRWWLARRKGGTFLYELTQIWSLTKGETGGRWMCAVIYCVTN